MYTRGNRVFYDSFTGRILWQTGEISASSDPMSHEDILGRIDYIDLEFGVMKYNEQYLERIDRKTLKPIFKPYPHRTAQEGDGK